MRLLFRNANGEYGLTKDFDGDDPIPPYAILSHTWDEGQEVTFKDLMDGTGNFQCLFINSKLNKEK
jgi:hypothetical protein